MKTNRPKRVLNVRIEDTLFREVRARAGGEDKTNAEIVSEALRIFLGRGPAESPNINPSPFKAIG